MGAPAESQSDPAKYPGVFGSLHRFYRGSLYQILALGLVSFTQPGIWSALSNLGAGGLASPFFVNAANVITFVIMVFGGPITAVIANRFSLKWVLVFGTLGYVPYSAALYCNSVFGTQWFLLFGAATCGLSGAAFWTSESAIAVGYPEAAKRGFYISLWTALNKLGSIIASSIQLALNMDNDRQGSISPNTFLVLIALQCLGLPLALTIAPADKLMRTDGTKPQFTSRNTPFKEGFKRFWGVCKQQRIYLLVPSFLSAQWAATYQGMYLVSYFTVRGRTLAGFIISILSVVIDLWFGWLLDTKFFTRRRSITARVTWLIIVLSFTATFIYNFVLEAEFSRTKPALDIYSSDYGRAVAVYCLYRIGYETVSIWLFWLLGTFDSDIDTLAYSTALLNSGQSLGSALAFAVGSVPSVSMMNNLIISAVVLWASIPTTTWSAWKIKDEEITLSERTDEEKGSGRGSSKESVDGVVTVSIGELKSD
ncbi:hypothetical protein FQN53_009700 [Emmonsiellopsis sp. PD_33]|nr:hypothetical protein FQN53_009700 [Emmonsiellopsis sp. PD_33]